MADTPLVSDPEHAWKTLALVNEWIRHADAKIAVTLAATAAAALTLFNLAKGESNPSDCFVWLACATAVAIFTTALCASGAIVPRVTLVMRKQPETFDNLLFYRHIARGYEGKGAAYATALGELTLDREALTRHIAEQVHANSTVVDGKYKWTDRAIRVLALVFLLLAATAALAVWG